MPNERGAEIQTALQFIEQHLKNELDLTTIAHHAAISKYHFHRMFHGYMGMTLANYIRKRRLSNAASELITSNRRILDVALDYQFESQEAFSRAFKRMFQMTPGQYRLVMSSIAQKKERKSNMNQQTKEPYGWTLNETHPSEYEMGSDYTKTHHGKASGYLHGKGNSMGGFGTIMQMFKANNYRGQRLQLSGFIATKNVEQWCGMWMRIDGKDTDNIQFDNMSNRPITGNTNWTRYSVVLDVAEDSDSIHFGVLLTGKGQVWIDSLQFDIVGDEVPSTNLEEKIEIPDHPVNLGFEEGTEVPA
ncbi:helix-turn-helix transcriptional regulator [Paenibacillus sp. KN14-4R]|uniref:helix-turn-helix transcriptional regulator n=1 Tax=Paenibacillus sp. KN14-4R TaxID=3445773 RepID=UPI003FA11D6C